MILNNNKGLSISIHDNGSVAEIKADDFRISARNVDIHSLSGTGLYLRVLDSFIFSELTGPASNSDFGVSQSSCFYKGDFQGISYKCKLDLAEDMTAWKWSVILHNTTNASIKTELFCRQDISLKPSSPDTINEYYTSQYIERIQILHQTYGNIICCRQNLKQSDKHPWLLFACNEGGDSVYLDGMKFFGSAYRQSGIPLALSQIDEGSEYAGESSVLAIKSKILTLKPGEETRVSFGFLFIDDHQMATGVEDLRLADKLFKELTFPYEAYFPETLNKVVCISLFNPPALLPVDDLNKDDLSHFFSNERRFEEFKDNELLSFFYGNQLHVVLKSKEMITDRPHGHIMQTNCFLEPDERIMSTNAFMSGIFNSHLTQGNTNFNVLLSIYSNQFHQASPCGQRVFVLIDKTYYLLGTPSAFEMGINHCRWIYKTNNHIFELFSWTSPEIAQVNLSFNVLEGGNVNLLVSNHFDNSGAWEFNPGVNDKNILIKPGKDSFTASRFPDGYFGLHLQHTDGKSYWHDNSILNTSNKEEPSKLLALAIDDCSSFSLSFTGSLTGETYVQRFENHRKQLKSDTQKAILNWEKLSGSLQLKGAHKGIQALNEILPWYGINALTHYLTPYGLEQFGGAAWGTRDVSQGPVDFLLHYGKYEQARRLICKIFSFQNPDGGWPQWWMFDSYHQVRAHEAHGDIIYWPVIALCKYVSITGDLKILEENLPYYHKDGHGEAESASLTRHIKKLIDMIIDSFVPGKALVPFGGGDWNDSLQPVNADLAQRLISSWTVMMNYQAFYQYALVLERKGDTEEAQTLLQWCDRIKSDFNKYLVKNDVVAGYGLIEPDGNISLLLHPSDTVTGIKYSLLPMNRGIISGIFNQEQALNHLNVIRKNLLGPDGARLMDRPLKYNGGIQKLFQRAETSTFFGREIGLMYIHEHIRYAEALAHLGKADEFLDALLKAIPVAYKDVVPNSDFRQSNCYYSSSDIHFNNRYDADENYHLVHSNRLTFHGGWRVYSSGPGIYTGIIISTLIGLRIRKEFIVFDPVIPMSFDGFNVRMHILDHELNIVFRVKNNCFHPERISINGNPIPFSRDYNPYRKGGAVIPKSMFLGFLKEGINNIEIEL